MTAVSMFRVKSRVLPQPDGDRVAAMTCPQTTAPAPVPARGRGLGRPGPPGVWDIPADLDPMYPSARSGDPAPGLALWKEPHDGR
jgi:hypothetical protein